MSKRQEELAQAIFETIKIATRPGNCTWGDNNPDAWAELFDSDYNADIVGTIQEVLETSGLYKSTKGQ